METYNVLECVITNRNVYILANIAIRVCFDNLLDCCTRVELLSWGHSGSLLSRS